MSTAAAVRAVTAALKVRLTGLHAGNRVFARPPDVARENGAGGAFLNVFLYEVLPNTAWRNQEGPGSGGAASLRPPLAVDLRYLLTAYPAEQEEDEAHELLGRAMLRLHDRAVLSRGELGAIADPSGTRIETQIEQVKLTQLHLPLEELSKLWTAFSTQYRLSVAYQASVVLIDTESPSPAPLPVLQRGDRQPIDEAPYVGTGAGPELVRAWVRGWSREASPPARGGDTLILEGHRLPPGATVAFDHRDLDEPIEAVPASVEEDRIEVAVPAGLPLGFGTLWARAPLPDGRLASSNRLAVARAGRIEAIVKDAVAGGLVPLQVTIDRPIGARGQFALLLGADQLAGTRDANDARKLRFEAPVPPGPPETRVVRVRVDGVDSVPLLDPVEGEPPPVDWDPDQMVEIP